MSKKRKVNAPASQRRQRTKETSPKGTHPLESERPARGTGKFFGIALGVLALGAVIVGLTLFLPAWLPEKPQPWEDYKERMVEDAELSRAQGKQTYVYDYNPRELPRWKAGVRNPELSDSALIMITRRATELLPPRAAAAVLVVAAQAHPGRRDKFQAGVDSVLGRLTVNSPEDRDLKARLETAMSPAPVEEAP